MIKDREQKEMLYKHFRAQGWMAQIEVPITTARGVSEKTPPVTDIDVLGFRPSAELKWQLVIGDCKTRRKESPVNRVLWVRGLQEAVGGFSSTVLIKREASRQIERDHKLFADRLGVLLIQEDEFPAYDKAIVYPSGSSAFGESLNSVDAIRTDLGEKFPALKDFIRWIMSDAWVVMDFTIVLRRVLARMRDVRGEFDPRRSDHVALILEASSAFAIPFASLVGDVFRGHLKPDQRDALEDAVRVIVWGGRENYDFYNALRRQVIAAKGGDPEEQLSLPNWGQFLELLRNYLEAPHLSFQTPQVLRSCALRTMNGGQESPLADIHDQFLLHLALKLVLYVCKASELPADAVGKVQNVFAQRITEIVESTAKSASFQAGQRELPMK